jgi:hypothetical protein
MVPQQRFAPDQHDQTDLQEEQDPQRPPPVPPEGLRRRSGGQTRTGFNATSSLPRHPQRRYHPGYVCSSRFKDFSAALNDIRIGETSSERMCDCKRC